MSKKILVFKIAIATLIFSQLVSKSLFARSPAVLPTIGISIDHVQSPPPDKMKNPGYEFSAKAQPKVLIENTGEQASYRFSQQDELKKIQQKRRSDVSVRTLPLAMTLIILSFPLIAWLYLNQKRDDEEYLPANTEAELSNTISLAERRERLEEEQNRKNYIQEKQTKDTEDDNFTKKAS